MPDQTRDTLYDGDTFEHAGRTFRFEVRPDEGHEPPWEDGDGRGIVTEWLSIDDKRPGWRELARDRCRARYFDVEATTRKAIAEGWDAPPYTGTKRERAARAVDVEYQRIRAWCRNEWHYVGVVVTLLDADGEPTTQDESLWGLESDDDAHLTDTAYELAGQFADTPTPPTVRELADALRSLLHACGPDVDLQARSDGCAVLARYEATK